MHTLALSLHIIAALQGPARLLERGLEIKGDADDHSITTPTQIAIAPNGSVFVVDQATKMIFGFDSLGRFLKGFGGDGGGRGTFRAVSIGWLADTLYAIDALEGRVTYFSQDGRILADSALRALSLPEYSDSLLPMRLVTRRRLIALPMLGLMNSPNLLASESVPIAAVDGPNARRIAAVEISTAELLVLRRPDGSRVTISNSLLGRLANRAKRWALTSRGGVMLGWQAHDRDEMVIQSIAFNGDTLFKKVIPYTPVPVPQRLVDSIVSSYTLRFQGTNSRLAAASIREQVGPITNFPPISQILAGSDGTMWIGREDLPSAPRHWMVLDEHGKELYTVETPKGFRALAARPGAIWGAVVDSLGGVDVVKLVVR